MELVFMWIKKYGHLKNVGLNFGGKDLFQVKYVEHKGKNEKEIEIIKITDNNHHHIENFFNIYKHNNKEKANIINVTAIIGGNGTGKSTILEIIQKISPKLNDCFCIFKNGNKYFRTELINTGNAKYSFTGLFPKHSLIELPDVIFYSNIFQPSNFIKYFPENDKTNFDLSTMKYLGEGRHKTKPLEIFLSEFSLEELNRQMDFVSTFYKIITDDFEFEIPNVITILDSHPNQNEEEEIDNEKIEKIINDLNSNEAKKFLKKIDFSNYLYKTFDYKNYNLPSNLHRIMKNIFLQWLLNIINSDEAKSGNLLKKIIEYSNSSEDFYTYLKSLQNKQLDILLEIFEVFVKIASNYHKYLKPFTYTSTEGILGNFNKDKDNIYKLVRLLKKTDYTSNLLQFKWRDMSSGEAAILTLFSRFHSIKHKIPSNNILLLLDEPDMYLNPSWVQKLINVFIEYLNTDFSGKTIQIILSSNKPICSSDLPEHNIIKLKKQGYDEETNWPITKIKKDSASQSFGANIYSLYNDGFFLSKDEGFIGSFARRKIQEIIEWLNDTGNYENKENIKKVIEIVGEPILRDKLAMMYNYKMDRKNDKNLS